MSTKYCVFCEAQIAESALFCSECWKKVGTIPTAEQTNTVSPGSAPEQIPSSHPQAPAPEDRRFQPQASAGGYPHTGYRDAANLVSSGRKQGGRGLLIGGIIGLVVLAAVIAVVVLMFAKPPAAKTVSSALSGGTVSQRNTLIPPSTGSTAKPPLTESTAKPQQTDGTAKPLATDGTVKKDSALSDIAGFWEGELRITRMEGFDKLPPDELPSDFKDLLAKILSDSAAMTLEIEEDGHWALDADIVTGMAFSSNDFRNDENTQSGLLITELDNGAFDVSFSEEVDEDGIKGTAAFLLTGVVYETGGKLRIEGSLQLSMVRNGIQLIQEGNYKVALYEPAETPGATAVSSTSQKQSGESQSSGDSEPKGPTLSTEKRPDLGDFLWYLDGVYFDGLPGESVPITGLSDLTGGWKALFYYDPDNIAGAFGYDFLNVTIEGDANRLTCTLDWYLYVSDSAEYDCSGLDDTELEGSYQEGGIAAGGAGYQLTLTDFYYLDGKQYGIGTMKLQSGEPTYVALVRP